MPINMLESADIDYTINPFGRKLTEAELGSLISGYDVLIAGTEPITDNVMERATKLRLISRVGVGLDNVDLHAAKSRGIFVSYTPEAPSPAVAELTVGLMLALLRFVGLANCQLHRGVWQRHFGRRLSEVTVGIIGVGRIGTRVLRHLTGFGPSKILVNDTKLRGTEIDGMDLIWSTKEEIYRQADIISLHVPLTEDTRGMIRREQLLRMKPDALLINTSRGGIVNETDLTEVLNSGHLGGAAIDVFEQEPYKGELARVERCLLTSHMGSMSDDCRARMEIDATEEAIRFLCGNPLRNSVPTEEYEAQRKGL